MIKFIATLALWLFLYQLSTEMVLSSLNKSLQKEGFFDTSYRLNSYQIVSKLSSSEEKKDWYELYNKKKEVKVNDKLEFDLPSYNFYFQSNLKKLNSFTNLDTLEKIDDPFIEQVVYYLRIGKSVRFEVKDRILYFFSNDLYSPYKTYYLKEKFDLHNFKKYNPTNLKLKDGTILTDTSKLTDYERFLIHLSNNIIDLPKESSLDELVYFLDMDLFNFTITFENDKVIVWNFDQPILISNLQTEKVKEILDKFCSTYKASTLFKKFFSDGTCYIKFRKETIYIQKVNEVTTILIILEFDKPEPSNDDKQALKKNKKKNMKYLADFLQNDGLKFELKFEGCKGTFIKKLKTLKKIRVNGKEYFFK